MKVFQHDFRVRAPLSRVAAFHRDPETLKKLTPPPIIIRFTRIEPLQEGSTAEFTMWIGPLPVRWRTLHIEVNSQRGFTITQIEGPFAYWMHWYTFEPLDEQTTVIINEIEAQPHRDLFWGAICLMVWLSLPLIFRYRVWRTRRELETPPQ